MFKFIALFFIIIILVYIVLNKYKEHFQNNKNYSNIFENELSLFFLINESNNPLEHQDSKYFDNSGQTIFNIENEYFTKYSNKFNNRNFIYNQDVNILNYIIREKFE